MTDKSRAALIHGYNSGWCVTVPKVESLQLQKSIAAVMRDVGPQLGNLHWKESTGLGKASRVLPEEAMGMLEAARTAKRLSDPVGKGRRDREGGSLTLNYCTSLV